MIKQKTIFITTFTAIALLLTNCSEQRFAFREKINVEKNQSAKNDSIDNSQHKKVFTTNDSETKKDNVSIIASTEKSLPENYFIKSQITKEILKEAIKENKRNNAENKLNYFKNNSVDPTDETKPCPASNLGLMLFADLLMLAGLILLLGSSSDSSGALLISSILLFLLGLVIFFIGKKPEPAITRVEEIPVQEFNNNTPLKVPAFSFTLPPKTNDTPTVSLALLHPTFAKDFYLIGTHPFTDFADRMGDDFKELLIARKYTFRGPYKEWDDMMFSDKAQTDLLIEIKINLKLVDNLETKSVQIPKYANQYWSCGTVLKVKVEDLNRYSFQESIGIGATITIVASECLTREKVWTKNIEIEPESIFVKSERLYTEPKTPLYLWTNDAGFYNPLLGQLERFYDKTMQKAWNYLDPRELEFLKPQVNKIREKSEFNRR